MTNEQLEQAIKTHFGALEVSIFDSDLSYILTNMGVPGQAWRVWYSKEGVYIKDNKRMVNFPYKRRSVTREQLREAMITRGKVVEVE